MSKPKDSNRNKCVQWEITFPHSGDICDSKFHEYFPPSVYSICAKEHHANGEPHLHLGLKLKKGISEKHIREYIIKKFPDDYKRINYSRIQNWSAWDDYCAKEVVPFIRGSRTKEKTPLEKLSKIMEKHPELMEQLGHPRAQDILDRAEAEKVKREEREKRQRLKEEAWQLRRVEIRESLERNPDYLEYQIQRLNRQ